MFRVRRRTIGSTAGAKAKSTASRARSVVAWSWGAWTLGQLVLTTPVWAQEADKPVVLPEIRVIGDAVEALDNVPGSAHLISSKDLEQQLPLNSNEALRMLPGVHIRQEDAMGLRQNIGIRGLNPNRSRNVLVMEDGIPISMAPYGEPELYYTPPIERMERIEVVKGSGSILFGPQTIGGVINYITPKPPKELTVSAEGRGGAFGYGLGQLAVGDTVGSLGYQLNLLHQRFAGPNALNLARTDATGKLVLTLSDTQSLSIKLNVYDEFSNATYLGLTTPQFENDPFANYAEHDQFTIRRYGVTAIHSALLTDNLLMETRIYGSHIKRYWRRQDFARGPLGEEVEYHRIIDGQGYNILGSGVEPTDGSSIYFLNSTGNRNREFTVAGVEPRATLEYAVGAIDNELTMGTRFHVEAAREQRIKGDDYDASKGIVEDDDKRMSYALAAYAQNRMMFFGRRLHISPGLRVESLWRDRTIYRTDVENDAGQRVPTDLDPPRYATSYLFAWIPGIGVAYHVSEPLTLFGGVHRGFAPPRTKDAITPDGKTLELAPEYSWNYEAGVRVRLWDAVHTELTGFYLDFSNQVIPPSEAGGVVSGNAVSGGATTHAGVEYLLTFDVAKAAKMGFEVPIGINYTYVRSRFGDDGWKLAIQGSRLPYAPEHQVSGRMGFVHPLGVAVEVDGTYVSSQFTDNTETVAPSMDGARGQLEPYFLLDAQVRYTHTPWHTSFFVSAKNVLDHRYIASRAPQGIQPGPPRLILGGVRVEI